MAEATKERRKGVTVDDLHRLLEKGEKEGCYVEPAGNPEWNDRGWYKVMGSANKETGERHSYAVCIAPGHPMHGCECEGWEGFGRCKHYALALDYHGWLPERPDDDPEPPRREATTQEAAEAAYLQGTTHDRRRAAAEDLARRHGLQTGAQWAGGAR